MAAVQLYLSEAKIEQIVDALLSAGNDALGRELNNRLQDHRRHEKAVAEAAEADRQLKASRAANSVLTKRQAQALAALRVGKSVYYVPWMIRDNGEVAWKYARSMGGAVNRMVERLTDEGLMHRSKITDEGLDRLAVWELKHGSALRA